MTSALPPYCNSRKRGTAAMVACTRPVGHEGAHRHNGQPEWEDEPAPIGITKFGYSVPVRPEDWFCQYCSEPLGDQAVTTFGGYAHRGCEPLFSLIDREVANSLSTNPLLKESDR